MNELFSNHIVGHCMNATEAQSVLSECLSHYRSQTYAELASYVEERRIQIFPEMFGSSGTRYNVTVEFSWHDKPKGGVRVTASVGKGIRIFFPLTENLVIEPGDSFVGE